VGSEARYQEELIEEVEGSGSSLPFQFKLCGIFIAPQHAIGFVPKMLLLVGGSVVSFKLSMLGRWGKDEGKLKQEMTPLI
jgi:hypothetical protein